MELQRIELNDINNLACNGPDSEYQKAVTGREIVPTKIKYTFVYWATIMPTLVLLIWLAIVPSRWPSLLPFVGLCVILLLFNEFAMRRRLNRFDKFKPRTIVRTPQEEEITRCVYHERCSRVALAGRGIASVAKRWNAYVDRVELGTATRFTLDEDAYLDITTRLERIKRMDRLVYRLLDDQKMVERMANSNMNEQLVVLSDTLNGLDFSMIDNTPRWSTKEFIEKYPALAPFSAHHSI